MNLDVFFKSKITAEEFILLSVIQQNSGGNQKEKLEEINDDYKSLEEKGFVKFVKAKNKTQSIHELIRLDKKGGKILVDLFTYSPEEDTIFIDSNDIELIGDKEYIVFNNGNM